MKKKPPPAAPGETASNDFAADPPQGIVCTQTSMRRASRRMSQLYDAALAPIGLTISQAQLLGQIEMSGKEEEMGGPALQALAGKLAIRLSALTHALRPLVRDGIVELRTSTRDRRIKHAVLTPLGHSKVIEAGGLWAMANDRFEAVLGADKAERLRALADRISSPEFLDAYNRLTLRAGRAA